MSVGLWVAALVLREGDPTRFDAVLDQLTAKYQEYGLPIPNPEWEPQRFDRCRWQYFDRAKPGGNLGTAMRGLEVCEAVKGIRLPPNKEGVRLLFSNVFSDPQIERVMSSEVIPQLYTDRITLRNLMPLACIESLRGHREFARELLLRISDCISQGPGRWRYIDAYDEQDSQYPFARNDLLSGLLVNGAIEFWVRGACDGSRPREEIGNHLKAIAESNTEPGSERLLSLAKLTLTKPPVHPQGEFEDMVSKLALQPSDVPLSTSNKVKGGGGTSLGPEWDLVERGFEAVPTLIAHLDDPRFAPQSSGMSIERGKPRTVGRVCTVILESLAGEPGFSKWSRPPNRQISFSSYDEDGDFLCGDKLKARKWFNAAQAETERRYVLRMVQNRPNPVIFRLLEVRHRPDIYDVFRKIVANTSNPEKQGIIKQFEWSMTINNRVLAQIRIESEPKSSR